MFFVLAVTLFVLATHGSIWALKFAKLLVFLFISVLVHEFGHAYGAYKLGHKVIDITVYPVGGLATIEMQNKNHRDTALIALAGPVANFLLFMIAMPFEQFQIQSLGVLSLMLGTLNMLPIKSFDGGVFLKSILCFRLTKENADTVVLLTSILTILTIVSVGLFTQSWILIASGVFMLVYGLLIKEESSTECG
jgi:Zn-dependent protease